MGKGKLANFALLQIQILELQFFVWEVNVVNLNQCTFPPLQHCQFVASLMHDELFRSSKSPEVDNQNVLADGPNGGLL